MADKPAQRFEYWPAPRWTRLLMSGRWHRRDGDSYGIVRQPGVKRLEPDRANNQTGDLRSPEQR